MQENLRLPSKIGEWKRAKAISRYKRRRSKWDARGERGKCQARWEGRSDGHSYEAAFKGGIQLKLNIQKSRVSYATCEEVSSKRDSLDYSVRH